MSVSVDLKMLDNIEIESDREGKQRARRRLQQGARRVELDRRGARLGRFLATSRTIGSASASSRRSNGSRPSGTPGHENEYQREKKNCGENDPAVAINPVKQFPVLTVIENNRDHHFDQGKENEERARQGK